jgi:NlpC/P60 family
VLIQLFDRADNLTRAVDKAHTDGARHDSMIHLVKVGLALSLNWVPLCVLVAQDHPNKSAIADRPVARSEGRLLSVAEGITVLTAAREHRRQTRSKPDCSHLVQEVYAKAGLEYPLASSRELYQGVESFERVGKPQPGDLIVWRGHVGLVVDPEKRTFYSSVRAGMKTESYDSSYWRRRGRPRFYRYRFDGNQNSAVIAARPAAHPLTSLAITDPAEDESTTATRAELVGLASENPDTVAPARSLLEDTILISEGREPTRQAIAQALITYADGAAVQAAALPDSFIIFERLRVDGLKLEGKRARAQLELHTAASVAGESVNLKDKRIKVPLDLQRTSQGWLLRKPQPVYFSRRAGVRALAERLAELARKDSDPRQQARLATVLDDLLNR